MATVEAEPAGTGGVLEQARQVIRRPELPYVLLAAAMLAAGILLLWITRGVTFFGDEWGFFADYPGFHLHDMLQPRGGHLVIVPVLLYKGVVGIFGPSDLAFRLILVAMVLICAALLFEFLRRRVGASLALGPAVLFLVLGRSGFVLTTTLGIQIMIPIAAGLGALLCLERRDRLGDLGACLLLILGVATYGEALPFVAGAALAVLLTGEKQRWRRSWVFLVPIALYVIWRIWAGPGHPVGAQVSLHAIFALPNSMLDSAGGGLATLTGLTLDWRYSLVVVALAGAILLFRLHRGRSLNPWIWVVLAMPLVYWGLIGAVASPARPPLTDRYQTVSVVLLLLLFAQLAAGLRASPRVTAAVLALFAVFALGNLGNLRSAGQLYRANSDEDRAELTVLELDRSRVGPDFPIEALDQPHNIVTDLIISASDYFNATKAYGSPAYSLEELQTKPVHVRDAADVQFVRVLGIVPQPADGPVPVGGALKPGPSTAVRSTQAGACVRLQPLAQGAVANLTVPPGGFSIRSAPGPPPTLQLGRFGPSFAAPVASPLSGQTELFKIPVDSSPVPWQLRVTPFTTVTVCPLRPTPP
jgi:hypothetical protein